MYMYLLTHISFFEGTVREWLEKNKDKEVDTIVFCVFGEKDLAIYFELMRHYFPTDDE